MWFQALVKVQGTHDGIYNSQNDQNDRYNSEGRKRCLDWLVRLCLLSMINSDKLEEEVGECCKIQGLYNMTVSKRFTCYGRAWRYTMMTAMPPLLSFRVQYPANTKIAIVIGIAAMVRPNSGSFVCTRMTTNCIVTPRKKKKSNFSRAM